MFLLVTGASGAGKSTARRLVTPEFAARLAAFELSDVGGPPQWNIEWRHRAIENAVQRALELERENKHALLAGDPVPPGELFAAPSADRLRDVAVCLLDVSAREQERRLALRGDDPLMIPHHVAFAAWMRRHMHDLTHMPHVITRGGWDEMRWERWHPATDPTPPWRGHVIDTTSRTPDEVAALVAEWIRANLDDVSLR